MRAPSASTAPETREPASPFRPGARARAPWAHVTVGAATAGAGGGSGRLRSAAQAPQGRAEASPSCSL